MNHSQLANLWYYILALVWVIYMFQESFVSGSNFLMYFEKKNESNYAKYYKTIGTHWDGIQVWLILAVGGLFASFPIAFSQSFQALYVAIFLLMYVLIIRGLAIELIYKTPSLKMRSFLKVTLMIISILVLLVLNLYLQTLYLGVPKNESLASILAIFNPFYLVGAVALVLFAIVNGFLFLGLNHGFEKLEKFYSKIRAVAVIAMILNVLSALIYVYGFKVIELSNILLILMIVSSIAFAIFIILKKFLLSFICGFLMIATSIFTGFSSIFPNIIVFTDGDYLSIIEGAADIKTLNIMLISTIIFLPIVILYQGFKYIRFWGNDEIK